MNKYVKTMIVYFGCLGVVETSFAMERSGFCASWIEKIYFAMEEKQLVVPENSFPSVEMIPCKIWEYVGEISLSSKENRQAIFSLYQTSKFFQETMKKWVCSYKKEVEKDKYNWIYMCHWYANDFEKRYMSKYVWHNGKWEKATVHRYGSYECTRDGVLQVLKSGGLSDFKIKEVLFSFSQAGTTDFSYLEGLELERISFDHCYFGAVNLFFLLKVKNLKEVRFKNTSLKYVFVQPNNNSGSDEDKVCLLSEILPGCQIDYKKELNGFTCEYVEYTYYRGNKWEKLNYGEKFEQWKQELDKSLPQVIGELLLNPIVLMNGMIIGGIFLHSYITSK